MPTGMMLRSSADWYLDAARENAFMADLEERGLAPHDFDPIPVWLFLDYAEWFQEKVGIEPVPNLVARDSESLTGTSRRRSRVAGALSSPSPPDITHFTMIPEWVERCLPSDCWSHTCTLVHFDELRRSSTKYRPK